MNIQSFSMPGFAYLNPTAYGDLTGANQWVWLLSHILTNMKMMSLFSILFGAGVLIFTERAEARGRKAAPFFLRRSVWLFLFGMIHAYLIWEGDILVAYSLCGVFVYLLRKRSLRVLIPVGILLYLIPAGLWLGSGTVVPHWPEEVYAEAVQDWEPGPETIAETLAIYRGGWLQQMEGRVSASIFMQTFLFLFDTFWRASGLMIFGMIFYRTGIITAARSNRFYWAMAVLCLSFGYLVSGYGVYRNYAANWHYDYSMFFGSQWNSASSAITAFGYLALIMLVTKTSALERVSSWLASAGRMAFSNYIGTSIICTFIFYGHGLGLFGKVDRLGQIGVVVCVWIVLLVFSRLWLCHFRYGPLEWIWRNLTYWRFEPIRKTPAKTAAAPEAPTSLPS